MERKRSCPAVSQIVIFTILPLATSVLVPRSNPIVLVLFMSTASPCTRRSMMQLLPTALSPSISTLNLKSTTSPTPPTPLPRPGPAGRHPVGVAPLPPPLPPLALPALRAGVTALRAGVAALPGPVPLLRRAMAASCHTRGNASRSYNNVTWTTFSSLRRLPGNRLSCGCRLSSVCRLLLVLFSLLAYSVRRGE